MSNFIFIKEPLTPSIGNYAQYKEEIKTFIDMHYQNLFTCNHFAGSNNLNFVDLSGKGILPKFDNSVHQKLNHYYQSLFNQIQSLTSEMIRKKD